MVTVLGRSGLCKKGRESGWIGISITSWKVYTRTTRAVLLPIWWAFLRTSSLLCWVPIAAHGHLISFAKQFFIVFSCFCFFETGSFCVVQAGLEQREWKGAPPCPAELFILSLFPSLSMVLFIRPCW